MNLCSKAYSNMQFYDVEDILLYLSKKGKNEAFNYPYLKEKLYFLYIYNSSSSICIYTRNLYQLKKKKKHFF